MYAIGRLICQVIGQSKEKKKEVVQKLGYQNLNKGYRRLKELIETGYCPEEMGKKLPFALGVEAEKVEEAWRATQRQIQEEEERAQREREAYERKNFRPHLYLQHERRWPQSVAIVAFGGEERWKVIWLPPDIHLLEWPEQERIVRETIRNHQATFEAHTGQFGRTVGYIYCPTYDERILFSIEGKVLNRHMDQPQRPRFSLHIGHRTLREGFLARLAQKPQAS